VSFAEMNVFFCARMIFERVLSASVRATNARKKWDA